MKRILIVVGTRPNFIKVTQFKKWGELFPDLEIRIAHTGQHSDHNMARVFFEQFDLQPDFFLDIDPGSPVAQMGQIMIRLGELISTKYCPDLIITPGDVNSTLAVALTANKMGIPLAHLESGLRSSDRSMPEEINRILTDEISDICFVTEQSGVDNLEKENCHGNIHFVGNTMIDTLVAYELEIEQSTVLTDLGIRKPFILMTMHRPATVDNRDGLKSLAELIRSLSDKYYVVFPIHPRTRKMIRQFNLEAEFNSLEQLVLTDPLGYFEFQKLVKSCVLVVTDSGGIQEETTYRQIPCITLRPNTERPVTVEVGSNTLAEFNVKGVLDLILGIEQGNYKKGSVPELWDGQATRRILEICSRLLNM